MSASSATLPRGGPELAALNAELEPLALDGFLRWSLETFGERVAAVTSFGASGMVILDHLLRLRPGVRVITLDTQLLFRESYELWEEVERRYAIRVEGVRPLLTPEEQADRYGPALWETEPNVCCDLRKVQPMQRVAATLDAWIAGIRRDQGQARAHTPLVGWDARNGLFKLAPLAGWTRAQVWEYIRAHDVPYNRLHDAGYASIGCTHCTRPANGGDERAGRWAGTAKTECGLHWAAPEPHRGGCNA
jgi:phosphoadenosine phosphosulfate reductase